MLSNDLGYGTSTSEMQLRGVRLCLFVFLNWTISLSYDCQTEDSLTRRPQDLLRGLNGLQDSLLSVIGVSGIRDILEETRH
jgi:hypothetical protein